MGEKIYDNLQKTWRNCSYTIAHKNLQGKLLISKSIPKILRLDYQRVNQIILNLVSNAVKFTQKGSVRLKVDWLKDKRAIDGDCFYPRPYDNEEEGVYEKDFDLLDSLDTEYLVLTLNSKKLKAPEHQNSAGFGILRIHVQDTGQGIEEKNLKQLFENFAASYNRKQGHLAPGLGLYVSRQLAGCMGGDLRVFSKKDVGSTFILCLPVEALESDDPAHSSNESVADGTVLLNKTALIVDDENFNLHIMSGYVGMCGVKVVETAANGQVAFEKYIDLCKEKKQPSVIFMDLLMPIIDGKECSRLIRKYEHAKNLPSCIIIITSGNCNREDIAECMSPEQGIVASSFLKKPIKKDDVLAELRKHKLIK